MNKPVFVKVDKYREILNIIDVVKASISQARETIDEINSLREKEDKTLRAWNANIDEITHKVNEINKDLFEPGK